MDDFDYDDECPNCGGDSMESLVDWSKTIEANLQFEKPLYSRRDKETEENRPPKKKMKK